MACTRHTARCGLTIRQHSNSSIKSTRSDMMATCPRESMEDEPAKVACEARRVASDRKRRTWDQASREMNFDHHDPESHMLFAIRVASIQF